MASNSNESNFTRRVSSRLRDQGVEPRPIDPQCSVLHDSTCPSGQVPTSSARYGDPDNIDHALIESETRCIETSAEIGMNAGVHQSGGNQTEEQSQAAMDSHPQANIRPPSMTPPGLPAPSRTQASVRPPSMTPPRDQPNPSGLPRQSDPPQQNSPLSNYGPPPRVTGPPSNSSIPPARNSPMPTQLQLPLNNLNMGYSLQNNMRPPIQVQPQEQSDEEIVQGIKDLKEQIRRAKLKEEFRKLQEELHELGSPNPSTRTNCYIATQGRQNSYMDPQNQVPQTSKAQDLPRSQVTSRPPPNDNRPLVAQGGLCVRENFEQSVRSPIYSQHQPEDSRYNITAGTFGGTPAQHQSPLFPQYPYGSLRPHPSNPLAQTQSATPAQQQSPLFQQYPFPSFNPLAQPHIATPSHTQAARTVHNTTPQQQSPPQPRPTRNTSDGVVNRPANEVSTLSNEPKVILHIQQTELGNAAVPDENPRSEQSRPAYPGPASTVSATKASTSTTSANDKSHFSQHHNGHSQRSGQPQPASPRPASTVSATEASTPTTSANDQSHFSQHHNGQSQRSAQLQPAPEQLEQTASSVTHKEPSLPSKTQALPASSDENAGTEPIMNGSTPLNKMKNMKTPFNPSNNYHSSNGEIINCIILIPTDCTGRIIGRKGMRIKQISRESRATKISIDTKTNYVRQFKVCILGNQLACLIAIRKIIQLVRQVHFHQNYPLQMYLDASYIPGIIGRGGRFLKRIKHTAKTGLVKILPTWPAKERNGMLVIQNCNINNAIKRVRMVLSRIHTIQTFQQEKLQAERNIRPSDQKVSHSCLLLANKVNNSAKEHIKPGPVQVNITEEKYVDKATETNYKTPVSSTETHHQTSMVNPIPSGQTATLENRWF